MSEKICRLCLQTTCENYQEIGESEKKMLKLNMCISKENMMCVECANNLQLLLDLKTTCVDMKERASLSTKLRNDVDSEPVNAENTNNLKSCNLPEDEIRCSFCTNLTERENIISLHESKDNIFLVDTLAHYIAELGFNSTKELLTCKICLNIMQCVSEFLKNCVYVEEEICKYSEMKEMDDKGQIELQNVQRFMMKHTLKFEGRLRQVNQLGQTYNQIQEAYTVEAATQDEMKCEIDEDNLESIIKTEYYDIKLEQNDCDGFQEPACSIKLHNNPLEMPLNKCEICPYEAKHRGSLKRHHILTHKKSVDTTHTNHLSNHILTHKNHSNIKMFKCQVCGFETRYKGNLSKHTLIHKGASKLTALKCEMCTFVTKYKDALKSHILIHKKPSKITVFKCEMCSFQTRRKKDANRHVLLIHKMPSKIMYKCELCAFETIYKHSLINHKLIHKSPSEITMFKCEKCTFKTKHKSNLTNHMLTHKSRSEIAIFKCEMCTFDAKYKSRLAKHMLLHKNPSEITMFKCGMCPYETKHKAALARHILCLHKSVSDITLFKCNMCTFKTKVKDNLRRHMLVHKSHAEMRAFKCGLCKFATKCKSYLDGHIKRRSHIVMLKNP